MARRVVTIALLLALGAIGVRVPAQGPALPVAPPGDGGARPGAPVGPDAVGAPVVRSAAQGQPGLDGGAADRDRPPLAGNQAEMAAEDAEVDGSRVRARGVRFTMGEYTLTGGWLEGDVEQELVFTGSPTLTYRSQVLRGDLIRFRPRTQEYRVQNVRGALSPDFLRGRLAQPLHLSGDTAYGRARDPITGEDCDLTTCDRPEPHFNLRVTSMTVQPGKLVVLRRVTFIVLGHRIVTLPTMVIPLDQAPRRSGYTPEFGHSQDEGWFVKSAFSYLLADRAPGAYRVDLMQRKGLGLGANQQWALTRWQGNFSVYGTPVGGTGSNLVTRISSRHLLSAGQNLTLDADMQQHSYYSMPETTSLNTRMSYQLSAGGSDTSLSVNRQSTTSSSYGSTSVSATLSEGLRFGASGRMSFGADYSNYETSSASVSQTTERLALRLQGDYRASNYSLALNARHDVPTGPQTNQSYFAGVEQLPEITLSNYRFGGGVLGRLPATFMLSAGRYVEGRVVDGGNGKVQTDRVVIGFDINGLHAEPARNLRAMASGSFQQSVYGDGSAQFMVRANSSIEEQLGRSSRLSLTHNYQQPEGGTPFRFDIMNRFHTANADLTVGNAQRLEIGARVGYDFGQQAYVGPAQPWQTLGLTLQSRPARWARLRSMASFDPNTGRFLSVTGDFRFRGRARFALDLVTRYDPARKRFGQVNGYLDLPVGRWWRLVTMMQYNGYLARFESRNLQIVRDLHCLEASIAYQENPFGYRADRQITFQLRVKAFPMFQRLGSGAFGQLSDTGIGEAF